MATSRRAGEVPRREDLIVLSLAAEEVQVARSMLWRWVRLGRLQTYRVYGDQRTFLDRMELVQTVSEEFANQSAVDGVMGSRRLRQNTARSRPKS
jgi:hypothetical protein